MIPRPKIALLGALLLAAGGWWLGPWLNPYHLDVLLGIGINIILAVSLNLINGHTGLFSLGHAGFMAVGAYVAGAMTTVFGGSLLPLFFNQGWLLFLAALLGGGVVAAVFGFVVGLPSLRLRGDYLAIVTLGFGEIIRVVIQNMESVGGPRGLSITVGYTNLAWTFGTAAVVIYVVGTLVHSTYGRGFLAVRDDEVAAEAMGINTTRYKVTAFVVGSFFAGVAGGLYGHFKMFITPAGFDFVRSIEIVVMVVLGGMGNTAGVVAAAILLTLLPEVLRNLAGYTVSLPLLPSFSLDWIGKSRLIIHSLLLIGLMLACPQGLFSPRSWGWLRRWKRGGSR